MERLNRIIALIRRNDPIINCLTLCSIELTHEKIIELIEAFKNNYFIVKIVLTGNVIEPESFELIFNLLLTNKKLIHLEITRTIIPNESIVHLANVLTKIPKNRQPIRLILRSNSFGFNGAQALALALSENSPICYLDLRNNSNISDLGVAEIANSLSTNTVLNGLDLINCGCNIIGTTALSDSLLDNQTLSCLLLQNPLNFNTVSPLSSLLAQSQCSLQELYLWKCELSLQSIKLLCESLQSNKSLTTLALSYNDIVDEGASCLAEMIAENQTLLRLHLGANKFSSAGASYLGISLTRNNVLQFLDLSRNKIRSAGVWSISLALLDNNNLQSLDIRHNEIESNGALNVCNLIEKNKTIENIRLSGNPFQDAGIIKIAEKLALNNTLKEIELIDVDMTTSGFSSICNALKNKHITAID